MKKLFSERNGYTKPSDVIVREQITPALQNAICSCYDQLVDFFEKTENYRSVAEEAYENMEKFLWVNVLNERAANFSNGRSYHVVATDILEDSAKKWYEKLDLIEITIQYLRAYDSQAYYRHVADDFVEALNSEFKRLHFAYRIINDDIVEIDSKEEIETIENALANASTTIRTHLSRALELYAQRPEGDYRNSIKESISAVEVYCREKPVRIH